MFFCLFPFFFIFSAPAFSALLFLLPFSTFLCVCVCVSGSSAIRNQIKKRRKKGSRAVHTYSLNQIEKLLIHKCICSLAKSEMGNPKCPNSAESLINVSNLFYRIFNFIRI